MRAHAQFLISATPPLISIAFRSASVSGKVQDCTTMAVTTLVFACALGLLLLGNVIGQDGVL